MGSTLPRHNACWPCNLIIWYLSIRWSDLETEHTIMTVRISRLFLWYAMNELIHVMQHKLMHVMQEQMDAYNAIMIFWIHGWSFKSFSLIKSRVQNWVSTAACFFVEMAYVKPPVGDVIEGLFVPKHSGQGAIGNAIALLGALIMLYVIYFFIKYPCSLFHMYFFSSF